MHYPPKRLKAYTGCVRRFGKIKDKEIVPELKEHLEKVIKLHQEELEWEYAEQIKILTSQKYT
jgi:hypothetical protein